MHVKAPIAWTALIAVVTLGLAVVIATLSGSGNRDDAFVIDQFDQIVGVQSDGSTFVQETIDVTFVESRRGIFRDLRDELRFDSGTYEVVSVDRGEDGAPWNWVVERWDGGPRIRIGDAAVWLDPGTYRYRLRYMAPTWSHLLADNPDIVETRINVPGFDWPTTIASTRLTMAMPGRIVDVSCVQGQRRSTAPCSNAPIIDGNMMTIEFDAFDVRHAATVAVHVPADAFASPLPSYDATPLGTSSLFDPLDISRTASGLLVAIVMLLPLLTLDVLYARSVYRDRVTDPHLHDRMHPTALPAPPFGFRATQVAGLLLRRTGQPLFLSALVDLDQRGYLNIAVDGEGKKRTVTISRAEGHQPPEGAVDRAVIDALLPRSGTLTFGSKYNESVAKRVGAATTILARHAKHVFRDQGFKHDGGQLLRSPIFKALATLAVLAWAGIAAAVLATLTPLAFGIVVAILAVTAVGWLLGHAPWAHFRLPLNSAGRDATAQARAFDEFVRTVEAEQLDWASGQPGISHLHPSVALLPYAIVLGHADSWFKRFGEIIAQFAQPSTTSTTTAGAATAWWATQGNFSAVQSAQSSTTTAPSSSGSGGGGGGSGGGGGGGGSW